MELQRSMSVGFGPKGRDCASMNFTETLVKLTLCRNKAAEVRSTLRTIDFSKD